MDFKEILSKEVLKESSINRLIKHSNEYDCGAITAFRVNDKQGNPYTHKQNQQRNRSLRLLLTSKGYSIISIRGKYFESNANEPKYEDSYFVIDRKETGNLKEDLMTLGELFEQDSVLFIPKGEKPYLIGTSKNVGEDALQYGEKLEFDKYKYGEEGEYYTTFVNDRPFFLESVQEEISRPNTGFGWFYLHYLANKDWKEL